MTEIEKNGIGETKTAFVLTLALTNLLLLAVIAVCIWFMFFVVRENHSLTALVNGRFLP